MKWFYKLFPFLCKHKNTETNGKAYTAVWCASCGKKVGFVNVKGKTVFINKKG